MNRTCLGNEGTGPRTLHLTGRRARLPTDSAPAEWKEEWYAGIEMMMIGIIGKRTKMNPPTLATAECRHHPNIYYLLISGSGLS